MLLWQLVFLLLSVITEYHILQTMRVFIKTCVKPSSFFLLFQQKSKEINEFLISVNPNDFHKRLPTLLVFVTKPPALLLLLFGKKLNLAPHILRERSTGNCVELVMLSSSIELTFEKKVFAVCLVNVRPFFVRPVCPLGRLTSDNSLSGRWDEQTKPKTNHPNPIKIVLFGSRRRPISSFVKGEIDSFPK